MEKNPLVSIIIVNCNGKQFLGRCLDSVFAINYPKSKFEVIVVDNNSKDLSRTLIKNKYPDVILVESELNLGFSGGNNLGVDYASGEFIVLLNNDTMVKPNWLTSLVQHIQSDPKIAAVNSKLLRYYPFLELKVNSDVYTRAEFSSVFSQESVGVLLEHILLEETFLQPLIHYRSGIYSEENGPIQSRWTKGSATILVPCNPDKKHFSLTVTIHSQKYPSALKTKIEITLGGHLIATDVLDAHEVKQYTVTMPTAQLQTSYLYQVQNAGNIVFKLGAARDRGAVTKGSYQTYEIDSNYFQKRAEVPAFCGASVILRKAIFLDLGKFDDSLFMYYEDIDFSLRARLMGYKITYEPNSVVLHLHSGSSKEWSDFFVFHVEKNYLAVLCKHYPVSIFIHEFIRFSLGLLVAFLKMIKWRLFEDWDLFEMWKRKFKVKLKVLQWIAINLFQLIVKRATLRKSAKVSLSTIYQTMY
ncbi:MAG: hypothetical protein COY81_00350 [Candidatus Pacebacteria bacterium CG_4_10_14_0_8_um_filter_43_12]|nr:MAG: hypothetical protein COY81_00350 [Candidatus Pacebacteria bacterium CG_4_10_14_0_8_um_filter_43_12]